MSLTKVTYSMIDGASVNVLDFGADPSGVSDSTAAINAAIVYAVSIAPSITTPGLTKSEIYFPNGKYLISGTIDATSLGAMKGESRAQAILNFSTNAATINCSPSIEFSDLSFVGNGANNAHTYSLAYLSKTTRCYFYNFNISVYVVNPSNTSTFCIWRDNIFQNCEYGLFFTGTVTTMRILNNQFNTSNGTAITTGNGFNFEICGNVFEDVACGINVTTQLVRSNISANWFERNALPVPVLPYQDLTVAPGYFTQNFISANYYSNTAAFSLGTNNTWADSPGFLFSSISSVLNGNDSYKIGLNPNSPFGLLAEPLNATCANFTNPVNITFKTQNANATQASIGGDFVVDTGAGSALQVHGRLRPGVDDVTSLGSASHRYTVVYATTGAINTSDENQKEQIENLSEAEKATALAIKSQIKKFKFKNAVEKKGEGARYHFGVIAQQVEQAFKDNGLDPDKYGVFCRDEWYTITDENGETKTVFCDKDGNYPEGTTKHTRLGVRYDELLAFIISSF